MCKRVMLLNQVICKWLVGVVHSMGLCSLHFLSRNMLVMSGSMAVKAVCVIRTRAGRVSCSRSSLMSKRCDRMEERCWLTVISEVSSSCRHPFNVEPNPSTLMGHGFVTPSALHYVRNHGAVPQIKWSDHKLTITGLVDKPRTFTMDEIAAMPQVTSAILTVEVCINLLLCFLLHCNVTHLQLSQPLHVTFNLTLCGCVAGHALDMPWSSNTSAAVE